MELFGFAPQKGGCPEETLTFRSAPAKLVALAHPARVHSGQRPTARHPLADPASPASLLGPP